MPALLASDIEIGSALLFSLMGIAIVFIMLMFLWVVIILVSKIVKKMQSKNAPAAPAASAAPAAAPGAPGEAAKAPGSAGEIKLYTVPEKTAAMLMAIVADKLQKPLNELRFISIKEVK